jgi:hypothetical protein
MNGPVASSLGVLARAVQRIDNPDPLCGKPGRVIGRLLRQHGVAAPLGVQFRDQQVVSQPVTADAKGVATSCSQAQQLLAGRVRQPRREINVALSHGSPRYFRPSHLSQVDLEESAHLKIKMGTFLKINFGSRDGGASAVSCCSTAASEPTRPE